MNKQQIQEALDPTGGFFRHWMGKQQRVAMCNILQGEESAFAVEVLSELYTRIQTMPKTYETDGVKGEDKIAYLHYFRGGVDAWIVEKDMGDGTDQLQAYGKITLTGDLADAEWGYISIQELIENNVEIDLHWEPKPMGECA